MHVRKEVTPRVDRGFFSAICLVHKNENVLLGKIVEIPIYVIRDVIALLGAAFAPVENPLLRLVC